MKKLKSVSLGHWLLLIVLIIGGYFRTREISTLGLQCEESIIQRSIEFPWGEMFDRIGRDTHPPLFYVIDRLWVQIFGDGITIGRGLSVIFGLLAIVGIYAFVREAAINGFRNSSHRFIEVDLPGLIAASIMAAVPLQIFWSMQIRMYALAVMLTAWSGYFLLRAWDRSDTRSWVAYTLCAILLSLTHYYGLFTIAAQLLCTAGVLLMSNTGSVFERFRPLAICCACLWFAWQPWLPFFLSQRQQVSAGFYLPKPSWPVLGGLIHQTWIDFSAPASSTLGLWIAQVLFLVMLLLLTHRNAAAVLIVVSSIMPLGASILLSLSGSSILHARYFLLSQVSWIAAIALVVCRLSSPWRYLTLVALGAVVGVSMQDHRTRRESLAHLPGLRTAVMRYEAAREREPMVVCNPMLYISALSYATNREPLFVYQPPYERPFYHCTTVLRNEQCMNDAAIKDCDSKYLWTMDADTQFGKVPLPREWRLVREEHLREWYADLILRLYVREAKLSENNAVPPSSRVSAR